MSLPRAAHFRLPEDCHQNDLQSALATAGQLEWARARKDTTEVLDNFPADIWASGAVLCRKPDGSLQWWQEARLVTSSRAPAGSRFWWDLPASALRDQLAASIGLWSLMPVASLSITRKALTLRNADAKIVVRGEVCTVGVADTHVSVQALRGYDAEFEQVCQLLRDLGAAAVEPFDLRQQLVAAGNAPQVLVLKGPYGIEAGEAAEPAVRRMALSMFRLARRFEAGVLDDTDTEFVHQYRVSLRKLRSLLSLMKSTLPADLPLQAKSELARMAGAMGTLRDLDVFLLDQQRYRQMLPQAFHPGFDHLITQISKDRQRALSTTRRQLRSPSYAKRCAHLVQLLESAPQRQEGAAVKPVGRVASARILKRYTRIRTASLQVHAETPDEHIHQIRIECKKLRYMLEFFAELYPKSRLKSLSRSLKRLQDVLGRFNDVSVQQGFLARYAERSNDPQQSAAIHGLIAVLHQDQLQLRDQAERELQQFAQDDIAANFSTMFGRNGATTK